MDPILLHNCLLEFLGTFVLLLLGDGVVANVCLNKTKGKAGAGFKPRSELKTVLLPLHPSASPRLGMTDHLITSCHHWSLRCRASAACLGLLNGKSAVSSHSCYYFLLVWYIYLFPFINNNRKQRCICIGNKYPSLCEYHKFLHDMKTHILYYLHYVREGFFFGYYGIKCSRNAHRHRLMKRWS